MKGECSIENMYLRRMFRAASSYGVVIHFRVFLEARDGDFFRKSPGKEGPLIGERKLRRPMFVLIGDALVALVRVLDLVP